MGFALFVLAVVVRLALWQPMWGDEYFSWLYCTEWTPFHTAVRVMVSDNYPPLYYSLAWPFHRFGIDGLRVPALLAGAGAAWVVYHYTRQWWAGLAVALGPLAIWHTEAKVYTLFALLVLWAWFEAQKVDENRRRAPLWLSVAVALSGWTCYLAPLFALSLFAISKPRARRAIWCGVVFWLPLIPFAFKTAAGNNWAGWVTAAPGYSAAALLGGYWLPVGCGLLLILLLAGQVNRWTALVLGPAVLMWALPDYSDKALIASSYGVPVLLATQGRRYKWVWICALIGLELFGLYKTPTRPDYEAVYASVPNKAKPLVLTDGYSLPLKYYADKRGQPCWLWGKQPETKWPWRVSLGFKPAPKLYGHYEVGWWLAGTVARDAQDRQTTWARANPARCPELPWQISVEGVALWKP